VLWRTWWLQAVIRAHTLQFLSPQVCFKWVRTKSQETLFSVQTLVSNFSCLQTSQEAGLHLLLISISTNIKKGHWQNKTTQSIFLSISMGCLSYSTIRKQLTVKPWHWFDLIEFAVKAQLLRVSSERITDFCCEKCLNLSEGDAAEVAAGPTSRVQAASRPQRRGGCRRESWGSGLMDWTDVMGKHSITSSMLIPTDTLLSETDVSLYFIH